jgi:hypothetical protein
MSIALKFAKRIGFTRIKGNFSLKTNPCGLTASFPNKPCAAFIIRGPHSDETATPVTASASG